MGKSQPILQDSSGFASAIAAATQPAAAGDSLQAPAPDTAKVYAGNSPAPSGDGQESDTLAIGHALFDDADDLPDEVNLLRAVVRRSGASYPPVQWAQALTASHAPATPRKPPRALSA